MPYILSEEWRDEFDTYHEPIVAPFPAETKFYLKHSAGAPGTPEVAIMTKDHHYIRALASHLEEEDEIVVDLHDPHSLEELREFIRKSLNSPPRKADT